MALCSCAASTDPSSSDRKFLHSPARRSRRLDSSFFSARVSFRRLACPGSTKIRNDRAQLLLVRAQGSVGNDSPSSIAQSSRELRLEAIEEHLSITHSHKPKRIAFNYGFQAKFLRQGPSVPGSFFRLAFENFGREWKALRRSYLFGEFEISEDSKPLGVGAAYLGRGFVLFFRGFDKILQLYDGLPVLKEELLELDTEQEDLRKALAKLTLNRDAVWERERNRPPVEAPWWILGPYYALCWMLDVIFEGRPIQRFWFLETVARMPYFSYISMLHLYETLGWWRVGADVRKVHFAEEWNEMHHLKIMESLGGDLLWGDRFFGQHAAFFYYWILNFMFFVSPKVAYNFSELIEMHAVDTYGQFFDENEELLKQLPPSPEAVAYYENEDLYMFDEFQTSRAPESRRPKVDSLYDVFVAIKGDEFEHVKTMAACQRAETVASPHKIKKQA
ncbi:uncharacterized protein LOC9644228 [Selaginella moellendorffii]|uniref:uncharacterized protein LOC9644228 n=1 Tax=Selaginella moellendorffii TaxID=88036 RepID=UPI000D1C40CA|nr:uncharacterized protein LOC9644228 [Selaginella moellendorffii]|eukprot:XP_002984492.2 uncharacterized protein LOC9644228 [Selaginella moellendorffii]